MATYFIEPERRTLHGHWSRDLPPVLTVDSGDTVVFRTLDAGWAIAPRTSPDWDISPPRFEPRDPVLDRGHALCGPVAVRGAKPGMTLAAHFEEILPGSWGWTLAGDWSNELNGILGVEQKRALLLWSMDWEKRLATDQKGRRVPLEPFMGVVGLAPDEPGVLDTRPPRRVGGNLDCRLLVADSTLLLPVAVEGGLFSLGDGHGAQGDGEVSGFALECPMERVRVRLELLPDLTLSAPRALTPSGRVTMGFSEDLNTAALLALNDLLDWMESEGIERAEALALASLFADLRITQIVNDTWGVHAVLREAG